MASTSPSRAATRPLGPHGPRQPADRRAVRGRDPSRRGPGGGRGPARGPDRQAHRALARGQVHRPGAGFGGQGLVGAGQPADLRGQLRAPPGAPGRVRGEPRPVQPGLPDRRRAGPPATPARLHRDAPGRASSPATCSAGRRPSSSPASSRTSRSSTCRRSRPTRPPRAPGPAPRSWSTCAGWR